LGGTWSTRVNPIPKEGSDRVYVTVSHTRPRLAQVARNDCWSDNYGFQQNQLGLSRTCVLLHFQRIEKSRGTKKMYGTRLNAYKEPSKNLICAVSRLGDVQQGYSV